VDEQQSRLLTWMAGALAIFVAAIVLIDPPGDDDDTETTPLVDAPIDDIQAVTIIRGDETITIDRSEGPWRITEPAAMPADQDQAGQLARAIGFVECGEILAEEPSEQFGLATPRIVATVRLKDKSETTLRVGNDAPVGWSSYISCGDERVRAAAQQISFADTSLTELRFKGLVEPTDPQRIDITTPAPGGVSQTLTVMRSPQGWMTDDGRRADPRDIEQLVMSLQQVQVATFDAQPPMPPLTTISLKGELGEQIIEMGSNGSARATLQDAPFVPNVPLSELAEPERLLLKTIFPDDLSATRISVSATGAEHTATRTEGAWSEPWAAEILSATVNRATLPAKIDRPPKGSLSMESEGDTIEVLIFQDENGQLTAADSQDGQQFLLSGELSERLATLL